MCRSHSPEDCRNGFEVDDDDEPSKGENFLSGRWKFLGLYIWGRTRGVLTWQVKRVYHQSRKNTWRDVHVVVR